MASCAQHRIACRPHASARNSRNPLARASVSLTFAETLNIELSASSADSPGAIPTPLAWGPSLAGSRRYILSIMAWPKPEHDTCLAPGMSRAKS
jgi:hypothetical protein